MANRLFIALVSIVLGACAHGRPAGTAFSEDPAGLAASENEGAYSDDATEQVEGEIALNHDPIADIDDLVQETPDAEAIDALTGGPVETVPGVPLVYNPHVDKFIDYFQGSGRERFEMWLRRSGTYIPVMEQILTEQGLPSNLVYLALIESGFSSHAFSSASAVGYWQFMSATGKAYGLRIDDWVDERRDPIKATKAAAAYLKDLYRKFGDWHLAAAGYNAGENKIARAIRRYKTDDYWEIIKHRGYIKVETKQYVPKLIAAITIAESPEKYGFFPEYASPLNTQSVNVGGGVDIYKLAYAAGITVPELKRLNPELRRWMTPPDVDAYALQLPPHSVAGFTERLAAAPEEVKAPLLVVELKSGETIDTLATAHKVRLADIKLLNPKVKNAAGEKITLPIDLDGIRYADKENRPPYVTYRVRRGDTLSEIARKYNVSMTTLRRENGIRGSQIRVGQTLKVPGRGYVAKTAKARQYKVRRGDTLSEIARKYQLTASQLARHNGLRGDTVYAGQLLRIP